jgi:hypothetical protein
MRRLACVVALVLQVAPAAADSPVTREEIESFMRRAKVVRTRELSGGVTRPLRLTLTDGSVTHDAVFQNVEEKRAVFVPARGPTEINFVDSWKYNIAAYRLAGLLGLESMMPVTIEYRWQGRVGALAWWMDSLMDERQRLKKNVKPPDTLAWNRDMYRMRVFAELVQDTDRNLGNVLVSPEWRVLMLDFTRAFRLHPTIREKEINQCDRRLLAALESLTLDRLRDAAGEFLTGFEAQAVMQRRDLLVAHVKRLVGERGEHRVLY